MITQDDLNTALYRCLNKAFEGKISGAVTKGESYDFGTLENVAINSLSVDNDMQPIIATSYVQIAIPLKVVDNHLERNERRHKALFKLAEKAICNLNIRDTECWVSLIEVHTETEAKQSVGVMQVKWSIFDKNVNLE